MEHGKHTSRKEEIMAEIKYLGEEDYLPFMEKENEEWKNTCVKQDVFTSFDGCKLNFYRATPKDPKAVVVIVHGMAEFFGKYREYMWYLFQSGYDVYFLEQRGHGLSEGKCPEKDIIYIDSYDTYVRDLYSFLKREVMPSNEGKPLLMIAHSMGGCIGTLLLEEHPEVFKAAILSSPMFKMKSGKYPLIVVKLIGLYARITGKLKSLAPNQKRFNPVPDFEHSSALSKARFDYLFKQRIDDDNYQMTAASFGWAIESMKATYKVIKNAHKIKIPVTVMTAGVDHLIDPLGYEAFKKQVPQAVFHPYETSRHEIFNSDDASRKAYYADVLSTLDSYLKDASTK